MARVKRERLATGHPGSGRESVMRPPEAVTGEAGEG